MQGRARRDKARAPGVCEEDLHLVGTSAQEPWRKGARGVGRGPVFLVSLLSLCLPDRRQLPLSGSKRDSTSALRFFAGTLGYCFGVDRHGPGNPRGRRKAFLKIKAGPSDTQHPGGHWD